MVQRYTINFLFLRKFNGVMEDIIARCAADMQEVAASGKMTLEVQVRAYDLLQSLSEEGVSVPAGAADGFCRAYEVCKDRLDAAYDTDSLKSEIESLLAPMRHAINEARFEAAAAASLHEFAKEVWQTWQTAGIFARRRALRDLRERAGFRLESHRIGNYVAKTYDLANEAQTKFGHAQQLLFAADVTYKCRSGVYGDICSLITSLVDDRPSS